jgi:hypothetical protein
VTETSKKKETTMKTYSVHRCRICGNAMRRVHVTDHGSWCWNCEPFRPGAVIVPARKPGGIEKNLNTAAMEFLKAVVFVIAGYAWAVAAYGVFPR